RRHDHAIDAVAALRRLLRDESLLEGMRLIERAHSFDRGDLTRCHRADRGDAGTHGLAIDEHGTGAALRQPAAEFRAVELEIVAKHVEQRRVRLGGNRAAHPIDFEVDGHAWRLPQSPTAPFLFRPVLFCADAGAASRPLWSCETEATNQLRTSGPSAPTHYEDDTSPRAQLSRAAARKSANVPAAIAVRMSAISSW